MFVVRVERGVNSLFRGSPHFKTETLKTETLKTETHKAEALKTDTLKPETVKSKLFRRSCSSREGLKWLSLQWKVFQSYWRLGRDE